jgi:hypothetical protein
MRTPLLLKSFLSSTSTLGTERSHWQSVSACFALTVLYSTQSKLGTINVVQKLFIAINQRSIADN